MQEEPTLDALNTLIEEGDNIQVDHMKDVLQLVRPAKKAKAAPKKKNPEPLVVPVDPPLDGANVEANAQATEQEGNADGDNEATADEPGENADNAAEDDEKNPDVQMADAQKTE